MTEEEIQEEGIDVLPNNLLEAVYEMEKDELVKEVLGTHTSRRYIKAKKERMGRIFPPGFRMGTGSVSLPHINFPPEMDLDF